MKPLIEYMLIKYSLTLRESSIIIPMMEKENSMHTMSEILFQLLRKILIAFLTKNCNKFGSDVKLQLEQEKKCDPFFAAISYYFNSILLLVATSAV